MKHRIVSNRVLAFFLVLTLLLGLIPASTLAVGAETDADSRISDPSTMDGWREFFFPSSGDLNTENAGGVWTDKSVFTDSSSFSNYGISIEDEEGMLVALSAIGSTLSVTGMANAPTDTMMVLDLSSSMYNYGDVVTVPNMLKALNDSFDRLFTLNKNNRVGVVIYFGGGSIHEQSSASSSLLMLPLDYYSKGTDADYPYLRPIISNSSLKSIEVSPGVKNSAGATVTSSHTVPTVAGTYAQQGLLGAMEQFLKADPEVAESSTVAAGTERLPVIVFMSDGEPTAATEHFTNAHKEAATMGNNQVKNRNPNQTDFVTQLTASYVKDRVDAHYPKQTPEFYTLSLGTSISLDVMDPASQNNETVNGYWSALINNGSVSFSTKAFNSSEWTTPTKTVNHTVTAASLPADGNTASRKFPTNINQRLYVDETFSASDEDGLANAFAEIVEQITLKTMYYPTLVDGSTELSGYITYNDLIGEYMDVTGIKGVLMGDTFFSGDIIAKNFAKGAQGGTFGPSTNPTPLGVEFVNSIADRLGISHDETIVLIQNAYSKGQLYYVSDSDFSNYLGWYSDESGKYISPWSENDDFAPVDAVYTNKSYVYLGEVDEAHSVTESDMMHTTVRVTENIETGELTVNFAVPAALIPLIRYKVSEDANGNITKFDVETASPIRLIYEVALMEEINSFTVKEIVSDEYIKNNSNEDGSINFYTNEFDREGMTGYGTVNTYSYFRPSRENNRYYYQEDNLVYTDDKGTLYSGEAKPEGTMYHGYEVYTKASDGTLGVTTLYHALTPETLATAEAVGNDGMNWYIPKGDVRRDYAGFTVPKTSNNTETLSFSGAPFTDINGHPVNDTSHSFVVGATLGNNGKIQIDTSNTIKISKRFEARAVSRDDFEFVLTNTSNPNDNNTYPAYKMTWDGDFEETVTFTNGVAKVYLKGSESIYISGFADGDVINITESEHPEYVLREISVNDATADEANLTFTESDLQIAEFINGSRELLYVDIEKAISHTFGEDYTVPDRTFELEITLDSIMSLPDTITVVDGPWELDESFTSVPLVDNKLNLQIKNGEKITLMEIPEGTILTVKEVNVPDGFTPVYWDNNILGDGVIEVQAEIDNSVKVENAYTPEKSVKPDNINLFIEKHLIGRPWKDSDVFNFKLMKQSGNDWIQIGDSAQITALDLVDGALGIIHFDALSAEEYTEIGAYNYQIIEERGNIGGITYDTTVHAFTVFVTDYDMDGALEVSALEILSDETRFTPADESNPNFTVYAPFENIYSTTGEANVTVDVNKLVTNESESPLATGEGFAFALFDESGNTVDTVLTDKSGFARFTLKFTADDLLGEMSTTRTYKLRELVPDLVAPGWTYSDTEYTYTVNLESVDGAMKAYIYEGVSTPDEIGTSAVAEFTNSYNPTPASVNIDFVRKHLKGRELKDGEFTFAVFAATDSEFTNPLTIGTNYADGTVVFDKALYFDKVGTYHYNVKELTEDGNRVVTDKNVYQFTVKVTDEGGYLVALVDATETGIEFVNRYIPKPDDISVDFNIAKTVSNIGTESITPEGFEFVLLKEGTDLRLVKNSDKDGKAKFTETYTEDDIGKTYNYTLKEVLGTVENITYSTAVYEITVAISLDENNKLVAEKVVNGVNVESILASFENIYDYSTTAPTDPPETTVPTTAPTDPPETTVPTTVTTAPPETTVPTEPIIPTTVPAPDTDPTVPNETVPTGTTPDIPNTGEISNTYLWVALLFVTCGIVSGLMVYRKRKRKE